LISEPTEIALAFVSGELHRTKTISLALAKRAANISILIKDEKDVEELYNFLGKVQGCVVVVGDAKDFTNFLHTTTLEFDR